MHRHVCIKQLLQQLGECRLSNAFEERIYQFVEKLFLYNSRGLPSQHTFSGHYWPGGEISFRWNFAGGSIVVHFYMLLGLHLTVTINENT